MSYTGDQKREYQREWIKARRDSYFQGKTCVICGSSDSLELDHIDRSTKLLNPASLWGMSDSNPRKIAELAKCQVLCEYCHKLKTDEELSIPCSNPERIAERKGCSCTNCKELKRLRNKKYRIMAG